jgi:hypothetical protein
MSHKGQRTFEIRDCQRQADKPVLSARAAVADANLMAQLRVARLERQSRFKLFNRAFARVSGALLGRQLCRVRPFKPHASSFSELGLLESIRCKHPTAAEAT